MYYKFDKTIENNRDLTGAILQAMKTVEQLVPCVTFLTHTNGQRDYILFRSKSDDGCASSIGHKGGEQVIRMGPMCNSTHIILKELCHALGLWHEQSRPDRDEYLSVVATNIQSGQERNFRKRIPFEFDSHGQGYDFASVMHYHLDAFTNEGRNTLKLTRKGQRLHKDQGSPSIGDVPTLSKLDAVQLNRLYNCRGSGVPGRLTVNIQMAENLPRRKTPYVAVTAVDDHGRNETRTTTPIPRTQNPRWNEDIRFGSRHNWQYIQVSIWSSEKKKKKDIMLTPPQVFSINPGQQNLQYCEDAQCKKTMALSTSLATDCHCVNGGRCLGSGACSCVSGYGGPQCQYNKGRLQITVHDARNLVSADEFDRSDPYVLVHAYDHNGNMTIQQTKVIKNNQNPVWNEHLHFPVNEWGWFTVQVMDQDTRSEGADDPLGYAQTFVLQSFQSIHSQSMEATGGGSLDFGYRFEQ